MGDKGSGMIRKNDPNSDFWQLAEKVSRKVDGFPPWKLGRLEQMEFKVGDAVRDLLTNRTGVVVEILDRVPWPYVVQFDNSDSSCTSLLEAEELELVPVLEQKSRLTLEVTDTEFIAVSMLGPYVELSINDDERLNLHPEQARRVAIMLLIAAEELELVPRLEQKSRFALEVTDTELIAVSTLGPYVELSINDDETIDLHSGQARRVAMMLLTAAEELEP